MIFCFVTSLTLDQDLEKVLICIVYTYTTQAIKIISPCCIMLYLPVVTLNKSKFINIQNLDRCWHLLTCYVHTIRWIVFFSNFLISLKNPFPVWPSMLLFPYSSRNDVHEMVLWDYWTARSHSVLNQVNTVVAERWELNFWFHE